MEDLQRDIPQSHQFSLFHKRYTIFKAFELYEYQAIKIAMGESLCVE